MLREFSDALYIQLTEELGAASSLQNDHQRFLTTNLSLVRGYLHQLKRYVLENPFESKEEEIWFFKYQKPRFYQWEIYYHELYTINSHKPLYRTKALVRYLTSQLEYFDRLFKLNEFQYQYYRMDATEMDEMYFVRSNVQPAALTPELPEVDSSFATGMDYLFAKFMAYETLKKEMAKELYLIEYSGLSPDISQHEKSEKNCRWTGEVVNLIEIAYGIYLNKQINEGEIGINDFFGRLGAFFGVNLGVPKRGFEDLKARKRLSRVHFIDRMGEAILKKMDEQDTYNPHIPIRKNLL